MTKVVTITSVALNLCFLAGFFVMHFTRDPVVVKLENSIGNVRLVRADRVRRELAERHGEDVVGDLVGREMVALAAAESGIQLDVEEFESRWHVWITEPGVKASLDTGQTTEYELRDRLVTLVLLDQLTLNNLNPKEREEALQRFYALNKRDLEQIKLRHILLESEKAAEDVSQRIVAGVDFAELAQRFSLDPLTRDQGGDLGWKGRQDLSEELRHLLFLIPAGRASKPIATEHGWHLFLVEEKRSEYVDVRKNAERKWCELRRPDTLAELRGRFRVESPRKEKLVELLRPYWDRKVAPDKESTVLKI